MSAWMIRAGHGGVYAEDWLDKGKIGIGWDFWKQGYRFHETRADPSHISSRTSQ